MGVEGVADHRAVAGLEDVEWEHRAREEDGAEAVSYTHLRAHETVLDLVCRLLLEKKKNKTAMKVHIIDSK